jgi:N-acyl-D-aspartate/D-glutamate deacylase
MLMAFDMLIKNGRVVDGSGQPSFYADVAIKDGKIVGVGKFNESATRVINADGRVVAPGFIDHHTHYDPQAIWDPLCGSTAHNGNTSVIVGQCGLVLAPARPDDRDWYIGMFSQMENVPMSALRNGINFNWESIGDYLDALGNNRGVNAGALIGHSGVRRYVMGEAAHEREATPEEIQAMRQVVRDGMMAGAVGFSVGNFIDQGFGIFGINVPSSVANDEERFALADVLGEVGTGVFQVSGGAPGGVFGPAYHSQDLARRTGRPVMYNLISQEINHPDRWREHLQLLEESFKSGIRAYASSLSVSAGPIFNLRLGLDTGEDEDMISPRIIFQGMPTWDTVMSQPVNDRMRALRDTEIRRALSVEAVETEGDHSYRMGAAGRQASFNRRWDLVQVFMTNEVRNRHLSGKSVEELAQEQGKGIMDAFLDLSLDENLETRFQVIQSNVDVESQRQILGSPYTVIGTTDGGARPDKQDRFEYSTRLLGYWVREKQIMSLEDGVYRLTGKTALMHDLHDRGFIAAGKVADITIFDPDTIDHAPREPVYDFPGGEMHVKQPAVGIDYVIVNGEVLLEGGEHTGALPGQVLRGPLYQANR